MRPAVLDGPSPRAAVTIDPGSFRDPSGRVLHDGDRILRTVSASAAANVAWLRAEGILDRAIAAGRLVGTRDAQGDDRASAAAIAPDVAGVLEHDRVPFVSYPYEWPFGALRAAALLHVDFHLELLERGATLVDGSAYNVQFLGARPVFIDVLSIGRYQDGVLWMGHRQFCEQFLNPLLLQALAGVAFNAWYRGSMEGLRAADLAAILPWRRKLSPRVLTHVVAQATLQRAVVSGRMSEATAGRTPRLPRRSLVAMLRSLRAWIRGLQPRASQPSVWSGYGARATYDGPEAAAKRRFVAEFAAATRPRQVLDLGCNTGDYAAEALAHGADSVIGIDADPLTAHLAFERASAEQLAFLPLVVDAADPSPARGWRGAERGSLTDRLRPDALLALAFEHHLAIGRNVPLDELLAWLVSLAPCGVIEFVQKSDPTVQRMLAFREDIFSAYSIEAFTAELARRARIVRHTVISSTGRALFWYDRGSR